MKKLFIIIAAIVLFLSACKKDKQNNQGASPTISDYSKLKVGNYWIYETYYTDTNGIISHTSFFGDSTFISKDTIINGMVYFKMVKARQDFPDVSYIFLRDSADCLIDNTGKIYFSTGHYSDTLYVTSSYPGMNHLAYFMTDINAHFSVPAGNFISSNLCCHVEMFPPWNNWNYPRFINSRYGLGVGLINSTSFYVASHVLIERKLVRYHVQ